MFFFRKGTDYRKIVFGWLPLAVAITVLSALVHIAVQQDLRQSANDPQIQMSEDASAALGRGATPGSVVGAQKVDIGKSLAPFLMVFSETGMIEASSATLSGGVPQLPEGVLSDSRSISYHYLTWQPASGVRSAIVVTHFTGAHSGFVVAGRSLREVERRESLLTLQVLAAWLAALLLSLFTGWAVKSRR